MTRKRSYGRNVSTALAIWRAFFIVAFAVLVVLGCLVARAAIEFRSEYQERVMQGMEVPGL